MASSGSLGSSQTTKQMASAALSAFLSERHARVPGKELSRALRRKQQRRLKKQARGNSHHNRDADAATAADSEHASASTSNPSSKPRSGIEKDPARKIKKAPISKEEREIRQRVRIRLWQARDRVIIRHVAENRTCEDALADIHWPWARTWLV
ncbi:hypothetical protein ABW21_db0201680 [Orbilia brochopaga]|nr:hypothetical protein ABW21_db0201680 [Drechslerella brochopaga]